jgi:hypothetical protein
LVGPIADLSANHWSPLVRQNAKVALSVFQRRDSQTVQAVLQKQEERPPEIPKWVAIINTAYSQDNDIIVRRCLGRLAQAYVTRPPPDIAQLKLSRPRAISYRATIVKPALAGEHRRPSGMNSD